MENTVRSGEAKTLTQPNERQRRKRHRSTEKKQPCENHTTQTAMTFLKEKTFCKNLSKHKEGLQALSLEGGLKYTLELRQLLQHWIRKRRNMPGLIQTPFILITLIFIARKSRYHQNHDNILKIRSNICRQSVKEENMEEPTRADPTGTSRLCAAPLVVELLLSFNWRKDQDIKPCISEMSTGLDPSLLF